MQFAGYLLFPHCSHLQTTLPSQQPASWNSLFQLWCCVMIFWDLFSYSYKNAYQFPKFHSYKPKTVQFHGHVSVSAIGNEYEIIQHHTQMHTQYLWNCLLPKSMTSNELTDFCRSMWIYYFTKVVKKINKNYIKQPHYIDDGNFDTWSFYINFISPADFALHHQL